MVHYLDLASAAAVIPAKLVYIGVVQQSTHAIQHFPALALALSPIQAPHYSSPELPSAWQVPTLLRSTP